MRYGVLRWMLVPIVGVGVFWVVFAFGIVATSALGSLCPTEYVVSGFCGHPWYWIAVRGLFLTCSFTVAVGIVLLPAQIAPSHRWPVSLAAFGCGALVATYVLLDDSEFAWEFGCAAVGGLVGLELARRRWARSVQRPPC